MSRHRAGREVDPLDRGASEVGVRLAADRGVRAVDLVADDRVGRLVVVRPQRDHVGVLADRARRDRRRQATRQLDRLVARTAERAADRVVERMPETEDGLALAGQRLLVVSPGIGLRESVDGAGGNGQRRAGRLRAGRARGSSGHGSNGTSGILLDARAGHEPASSRDSTRTVNARLSEGEPVVNVSPSRTRAGRESPRQRRGPHRPSAEEVLLEHSCDAASRPHQPSSAAASTQTASTPRSARRSKVDRRRTVQAATSSPAAFASATDSASIECHSAETPRQPRPTRVTDGRAIQRPRR